MSHFRIRPRSTNEYFEGQHRFEHWYRDNTMYFITARCRDKYHASMSEEAKSVFWDRFYHWSAEFGFTPCITTLMSNHYHTLGYMRKGDDLGRMMQRIHGSVAKLVNDLLPERRLPFWREAGRRDYFDGCLRDELQCRRAYRYTLLQSVRHGICVDYQDYPHTHVRVELEATVKRALEINAFMEGVGYKRYQRKRGSAER
jgi:REP element-mobilizing transposase RayT